MLSSADRAQTEALRDAIEASFKRDSHQIVRRTLTNPSGGITLSSWS